MAAAMTTTIIPSLCWVFLWRTNQWQRAPHAAVETKIKPPTKTKPATKRGQMKTLGNEIKRTTAHITESEDTRALTPTPPRSNVSGTNATKGGAPVHSVTIWKLISNHSQLSALNWEDDLSWTNDGVGVIGYRERYTEG